MASLSPLTAMPALGSHLCVALSSGMVKSNAIVTFLSVPAGKKIEKGVLLINVLSNTIEIDN